MPGNARQVSRDRPAPSNATDHQIDHGPDDVAESKHPENKQEPENNHKLPTGALGSRFLDDNVSDKNLNSSWQLTSQENSELR